MPILEIEFTDKEWKKLLPWWRARTDYSKGHPIYLVVNNIEVRGTVHYSTSFDPSPSKPHYRLIRLERFEKVEDDD